jgi:hypothetical protein
MSAKEYNEWVADYRIAPYGEIREDIRTATIVQSNLAPHSKESIAFKDCMLNFEPPKKQAWKEQRDACMVHSKVMNKLADRKKK